MVTQLELIEIEFYGREVIPQNWKEGVRDLEKFNPSLFSPSLNNSTQVLSLGFGNIKKKIVS